MKKTSYQYGKEDQERLRSYYLQSKIIDNNNHEYNRVKLGHDIVNRAKELLFAENTGNLTLVDIGCSIGTFAIEFSKKGFKSYGLDFDPEAIKIAKLLNSEEKANAEFHQMDVSDWNKNFPKIDIAICFDIFEHLHDDEIGAMFNSIKKQLSENGCIVFHTLPLEYDYLFWNVRNSQIQFPFLLAPFKFFGSKFFAKLTRIYALIYDIGLILLKNRSHKQLKKRDGHCNPLTQERLLDIFERAGYKLLLYKSGFITEQFKKRNKKYFRKHSITHRSLWGIAVPEN